MQRVEVLEAPYQKRPWEHRTGEVLERGTWKSWGARSLLGNWAEISQESAW